MLTFQDTAVVSACGRYRYVLTRHVGPGSRAAVFILLNPSTADASNDDPTIRRCIGFARRWDCGKLTVLNLFALRATDPAVLKWAEAPVGPENRAWFDRTLAGEPGAGPVVCGWGVHGARRGQDRIVGSWLEALGVQPASLGVTKGGHPRHPLYVPYSAELQAFGGYPDGAASPSAKYVGRMWAAGVAAKGSPLDPLSSGAPLTRAGIASGGRR